MKIKPVLIYLLFFFSLSISYSQSEAEIERLKERYAERTKELKDEIVTMIAEDLKLDAFEKEIVSQSIFSYYDEVQKINVMNIPIFEKRDLVSQLDGSHFNDLKTILNEEQISYILEQLKGDWKQNKKDKKRKKRRKN
ncbi:hypothetical protein AB9K26_09905 [Psychroserpens sp. XS_ASV72]|uniref:hypothetical protein n=1 Tax=Psychroserpens sp. XS_ASV72 TaxID=3241293 RepID=UPI0035118870